MKPYQYTPIRWERSQFTKEQQDWTPRRVAAAKRAVEREAQALPLFPELRRDKTVQDRMDRMDRRHAAFIAQHRENEAQAWRRARAGLRRLAPLTRAGVVLYWNTSYSPAKPHYLLDLIHRVENKQESGWRHLRKRRQLQLISDGRLPRPNEWRNI